MEKLYVDSYLTALAIDRHGQQKVAGNLSDLVKAGHQLVFTEASALDNLFTRKNPELFRKWLISGAAIIEVYQGNPGDVESGIRAMLSKPFTWSSYDGDVTDFSNSELSTEQMVRRRGESPLVKVYNLMLKHAKAKGEWEMGPWKTANFFSDDQLKELNLDSKKAGNRSLVHEAMKTAGYPAETYVAYTCAYLAGIVSQHHCDRIALLDLI